MLTITFLIRATYSSAISLIGYSSNAMLKVTLNRLKPQAKGIKAAEHAEFRARSRAIEQIFNLRTLRISKKQLTGHVMQPLALSAIMQTDNVNANLVRAKIS